MNFSIVAKSLYTYFLYKTGFINKKLKELSQDNFLVLMYHRVIPKYKVNETIQDGMYVTPESFEIHLRFLKKNFSILPVSELLSNSDEMLNKKYNKPICFLTFDDGWYDFYTYAFPLLKKYNAPATVFLPTGLINTNRSLWTDQVAYLLTKKKDIGKNHNQDNNLINDLIISIESISGRFGKRLEQTINLLKPYSIDVINNVIMVLSKRWHVDSNPEERSFLSWNEIWQMGESKLVYFGSHTVNHKILTTIEKEDVFEELKTSKEDLIKHARKNFLSETFCYPNGNYNPDIVNLVKKAGYRLAFSTHKGWEPYKYSPLEIKRMAIHNDIAFNTSMFASRITDVI